MKIRENPSGTPTLAYLLVSSEPSPPRHGSVINNDLRGITINFVLTFVLCTEIALPLSLIHKFNALKEIKVRE